MKTLIEEIRAEIEFCKRNPELPLVFVVFPTVCFLVFIVIIPLLTP